MRKPIHCLRVFGLAALGVVLPAVVRADSVRIGVQSGTLDLGISIGHTPPLLLALPEPMGWPRPAPPPAVYIAPNVLYDYFVYQKTHYV